MHPLIFLWSHPRSMSTATERIMRERGDFHCLHEPFLRYYYKHKIGKTLRHFDDRGEDPETYADTREMILQLVEQSPVFAKDMSYYVVPELFEDRDFLRRIRHCFLIRNPRKSILSYYRLDPEFSREEVGLNAQWRLFQALKEDDETPLVLEAEAIQQDPQGVMSVFWERLDIDYIAEAFEWNEKSMPDDWQYVKGWHTRVGGSTGIRPVSADDEQKVLDEFEQVSREAPQLNDYLSAHIDSYESLKAHSLTVDG